MLLRSLRKECLIGFLAFGVPNAPLSKVLHRNKPIHHYCMAHQSFLKVRAGYLRFPYHVFASPSRVKEGKYWERSETNMRHFLCLEVTSVHHDILLVHPVLSADSVDCRRVFPLEAVGKQVIHPEVYDITSLCRYLLRDDKFCMVWGFKLVRGKEE